MGFKRELWGKLLRRMWLLPTDIACCLRAHTLKKRKRELAYKLSNNIIFLLQDLGNPKINRIPDLDEEPTIGSEGSLDRSNDSWIPFQERSALSRTSLWTMSQTKECPC